VRFFCFICVSTVLSAPFGFAGGSTGKAVPSASAAAPILSVVKIGPDGHLVRVHHPVRGPVKVGHRVRTLRSVPPPSLAPAPDTDIQRIVDDAAKRHNVDPLLVNSVIRVESGFDPAAISSKGAQGLMQLIPATARRFGVVDAFDPKENIEGGVKYLEYLQTLFPNDLNLTIAAYNAGEGAVSRYNRIPPYPETVAYVDRVHQHYTNAKLAQTTPDMVAATLPVEEPARHVEQVFDVEGRLYLVTR
jgi:Transglycosylase SLT domain